MSKFYKVGKNQYKMVFKYIFNMIMKVVIFAILILHISTRSYPLFKQCNSAWRDQQLGTSSKTLCSGGSIITNVAMGLTGVGVNFDPSTLNKWLKTHGGYLNGDTFVWGSVNELGLLYEGKVANRHIKSNIDEGKVVICNVRSGTHWILAYQYTGDTFFVNDPLYTNTTYNLRDIVEGQSHVYKVGNFTEVIM